MSTLTALATLPALAEPAKYGSPAINIAIFATFIVVTLFVVIRVSASKQKSAAEYYTGGASFSGKQNGFAIAGDYLSAASFLGIPGAIAIFGYDGFLYSIGFLVAWLVALLLVAELLRNTGRFTMADVLSFRLKQRPVRIAAALSTITISLFYMVAQMAGAGGLVSLLLGVSSSTAQALVITLVGVVMMAYVLIGGMKGTTWVQIIKAGLLISGSIVITIWVLAKFGMDFSGMLDKAVQGAPKGEAVLEPGLKYGKDLTTRIDFISLALALVLGTAGLPHVLMRFYTVPTSKEARKSVEWAIWLIGGFFLLTLVMGYGAAAIVGPERILAAPGKENSAAPLLSYFLAGGGTAGSIFMGIISAIAFATILAVVAGLTITLSATTAHDLYNQVIKKGKATPEQEHRVARIASVVAGAVAIIGGIGANGQNIAFLVALAFGVAAAANLPTILYSLFWKRFNTRGALWSMYGGLIISIVWIIFSPVFSGSPTSLIKGSDFSFLPLANPAIVAVPIAFLLGYIGTMTSKEHNELKYAEMEVRSLTGHGAGGAIDH